MKHILSIVLLIASLTSNAKTDSTSVCILETTVLQSTISELNMINNFMIKSEFQESIQIGNQALVLFFNQERDTVLVREVNYGSDETYRMFVNATR